MTQILDTLKALDDRIAKLESHFNRNQNREKKFVCHRLSILDKHTLNQLGLPIDSVLALEKAERFLDNDNYVQSVVSGVDCGFCNTITFQKSILHKIGGSCGTANGVKVLKPLVLAIIEEKMLANR